MCASSFAEAMNVVAPFQLGDYAETDRHYGVITWEYNWETTRGQKYQFELHRLECLHGPQKERCTPYERVFSTQLKHAPSPEELIAQALGDDYL